MASSGNKRRWVLHFDINNTILMKDGSKGLNTTDNVSDTRHRLVNNKITNTVSDRSLESSVKVLGVRLPKSRLRPEMRCKMKRPGPSCMTS